MLRKKIAPIVESVDEGDDDDGDDDLIPESNIVVVKEPVTLKKVMTRTITALILTGLYLCMLQAGHLYCILVGVIAQAELYRELVNVRYVEAKERKMPWFRTLQWAWFFVPMFFVYGETLHKFCREHHQLVRLTAFTEHIGYLVFIMYCILFILSVLTLKQGLLKFQLSQFMWSIVTVCLVVFQTKFFALNTLNGLFWFFFPVATVVMNDCSAYFCGITMGKRYIKFPLNSMSPNKSWEGFLGALVLTLIFSFYFPALLARFTWIICPAEGLYFWPFPPALECNPNPVFVKTVVNLPLFGNVLLFPIQIHGLAYGLFASLVAPFGGFFASAIKRAYKKKDFDSFMPGHGGLMDRMDCQLLMMAFTAFHYRSFIAPKSPTVQKMLFLASLMPLADKQLFLQEFTKLISDSS